MTHMRTTVTIDDAIYRDAKAAAAKSGRPLGALIEDALRVILPSGPSDASLPPLRQFHGNGVRPGINIDSWAELTELMDDDKGLDALR